MNNLELKLDKFGRVLIPQKIRRRVKFVAGYTLAVTIEKGQIILSLNKEDKTLFKKKNNVLVYTGKLESKKTFRNWEKNYKC